MCCATKSASLIHRELVCLSQWIAFSAARLSILMEQKRGLLYVSAWASLGHRATRLARIYSKASQQAQRGEQCSWHAKSGPHVEGHQKMDFARR